MAESLIDTVCDLSNIKEITTDSANNIKVIERQNKGNLEDKKRIARRTEYYTKQVNLIPDRESFSRILECWSHYCMVYDLTKLWIKDGQSIVNEIDMSDTRTCGEFHLFKKLTRVREEDPTWRNYPSICQRSAIHTAWVDYRIEQENVKLRAEVPSLNHEILRMSKAKRFDPQWLEKELSEVSKRGNFTRIKMNINWGWKQNQSSDIITLRGIGTKCKLKEPIQGHIVSYDIIETTHTVHPDILPEDRSFIIWFKLVKRIKGRLEYVKDGKTVYELMSAERDVIEPKDGY